MKNDVSELFGRDISHKQKAIDTFGVTDIPRHGFFMLDDGRYLSGLEKGADPRGNRTLDHGSIGDVYSEGHDGGHGYMYKFMDEGNIRMQPESNSLSFTKKPTEAQMRSIMRLVRDGKLDTMEYVRNPNWNEDNEYLNDIMTTGQVIDFINRVFGNG